MAIFCPGTQSISPKPLTYVLPLEKIQPHTREKVIIIGGAPSSAK